MNFDLLESRVRRQVTETHEVLDALKLFRKAVDLLGLCRGELNYICEVTDTMPPKMILAKVNKLLEELNNPENEGR